MPGPRDERRHLELPRRSVKQTLKDGVRIATGLHNAVALTVNPGDSMV